MDASVKLNEDDNGRIVESLYSVVQRIREDSERPPTARLFYVIYLNEGVKNQKKIIIQKKIEEMQSHFETTKKKDSLVDQQAGQQKEVTPRQFSGCFIEYGLFCLHLIEGESSQINQYMNLLYTEFHQEKSVFSIIRVISFTEENPFRLSEKSYFEDVQNPPQVSLSSQEQEQPATYYTDKAWEIYSNVSKALSAHSKKQAREKSMKKIHSEFRFNSEDISILLSSNFMSIDDYHQFYLADLEINLDSEKEYPYKPSLTKVLEYSDNATLEEVRNH